MSRAQPKQLNIRSSFARERAIELARTTGMTVTRVVEEALRAYVPTNDSAEIGELVRRGPLLVMPSRGRTITLEETNAEIEASRNRDEED